MSTSRDQLRAIVDYVGRVDAAAYNTLIEMQKALDTQLDDSVYRVRTEMADADDELRGHLRFVLAGSISDRIKGAVLLGVGIVFAMAGSVVGTLAS
ncbi:MAG TPA: hypothetical protein VKB17_10140 [Thermoleophilaceae bacterium]|nr:hypothetical protein [Thermoleophilaceae bacterium]